MVSPALLKQLQYRSTHRGSKEMDILLGRFITQHLATLTHQECDAYTHILTKDDTLLYAYLVQGASPPAGCDLALLAKMRTAALAAPL